MWQEGEGFPSERWQSSSCNVTRKTSTTSRWSVLIVDDACGVRSALTRALRGPDVRVCSVASLAEARALLAARSFDLVVAAARLAGGESGIDLLTDIRSRSPQTLRALLTGEHDPDLMWRAINRAAVDCFVAKPWDGRAVDGLLDRLRAEAPGSSSEPWEEAARWASMRLADGLAIAGRILVELNSCNTEAAIARLLCPEFSRLARSEELWWADAETHVLKRLCRSGAAGSEEHRRELGAPMRRLVDGLYELERAGLLDLERIDADGIAEKRAVLGLPIRRGRRLLAVFAVSSARSGALAGTALDVADEIGEGLGLALERVRRASERPAACVCLPGGESDGPAVALRH